VRPAGDSGRRWLRSKSDGASQRRYFYPAGRFRRVGGGNRAPGSESRATRIPWSQWTPACTASLFAPAHCQSLSRRTGRFVGERSTLLNRCGVTPCGREASSPRRRQVRGGLRCWLPLRLAQPLPPRVRQKLWRRSSGRKECHPLASSHRALWPSESFSVRRKFPYFL
jgi:hypothetical protein